MMETKRSGAVAVVLALLTAMSIGIGCEAVRVLPAALRVEQEPGSRETYTLTLINDTDATEDLRLYVGDWRRFEDGEHDWGVPQNGARWRFERPFGAGEEAVVRYAVRLPDDLDLAVQGYVRSSAPDLSVRGDGSARIAPGLAEPTALTSDDGSITLVRSVEAVDDDRWATVRLTIRTQAAIDGLEIQESFPERREIISLDAGDATFATINRSNAGWVTLSHDRVVLASGESREVAVTVDAPERIDGTYWGAVFVESQPEIVEQGGTRVLSIYRTAIKLYVTALGTGVLDGQVVDVSVPETAPLTIEATFENTGTVELVVSGEAEVIDRTGETVRDVTFDAFKVLPGARRVVSAAAEDAGDPLPEGIYQAVVSFDFGGGNPVVGVRGFRVR